MDWTETTIGSLIDDGLAHLQTGPFGTALKAEEYSSEGVPLISVREIRQGYFEIGDHTPRVNEDTVNRLPKFVLEKGDIVFGRKGGVDRSALVQDEHTGWFLGSDGIRLRISDEFDHKFISYQLRSPQMRQWLIQHSGGSTMASMNQKILSRLPLSLPPLPEQRRIAHILGTLDDKIELNRRMNETLEGMAQALFKSWFIDFDPVLDNAILAGNPIPPEFEARAEVRRQLLASGKNRPAPNQQDFPTAFTHHDDLGPIPQGWEVKPLSEITSKIGSGATPRGGSSAYVDSGTAIIRSQNVHDHEFRWPGLARITDDAAHKLRSVTVEADDVLINITGDSILRTCVVPPNVLPARVNQHVAIIRPIASVPSRYLHLYLVRAEMKELLLGMSAGGTRKAITKGHLEATKVLVPESGVLERFNRSTGELYDAVQNSNLGAYSLASARDVMTIKMLRQNGEI